MASTINASSAGIVETADNSGILQLQTNGVQAIGIDTSQNVTIPKNLTVNGTFSGNISSLTSSGNIISTGGYVECTNGGYAALQTNSVAIGNSLTGIYYNGSNALALQVNNTPAFAFYQTGQLGWGSYTIPKPSGSTSTFLRNDGTWAVPAGGGGGGASLSADQTFTGLNTFSQLVTCTASSGYSALGSNSVQVGNLQTGIFYNGSNAIGLQVNNTPVFAFYQSGVFTWGSYNISAPGGSTSTYLRNDGTWVNPTASFLSSSNSFTTGSIQIGSASSSGSGTITSQSYNFTPGTAIYRDPSSFAVVISNGTGQFIFNSNGTATNNTGTWGTTSDARIKENVTPARNYLDSLCQLQVVNYNLINDPQKMLGFVAQQVETVMPGLVFETVSEEYDIPDLKSVKTSILIPMLVQAVQELKTQVDTLKAKVGA